MNIKIIIIENAGFDRVDEPVSIGVPFRQGALKPDAHLSLCDEDSEYPLQKTITLFWPDGSVKWALIAFKANVRKNGRKTYIVSTDEAQSCVVEQDGICINQNETNIEVNTGCAIFLLDKSIFKPFLSVKLKGKTILGQRDSSITFENKSGQRFEPEIESINIESKGPIHSTLCFGGYFGSKKRCIARWISRVHFFKGLSDIRMDFTLWNPGAAKHPGGLWDLGDPGSVFFKDLSINLNMEGDMNHSSIKWTVDGAKWFNADLLESFSIFQGSSGGKNYKSRNHVNCHGEVPITHEGFQVIKEKILILEGKRAEPVVLFDNGYNSVAVAINKFWQNFPKSLSIKNNSLTMSLFPQEYGDLFELQGGERKTHRLFLGFGVNAQSALQSIKPLKIIIDPSYVQGTDAVPYLTLRQDSESPIYHELIQGIIDGDNSFINRREIIDEYGWRHFGELYADHEAIGYKGDGVLISHYNNQYDFIYNAARQYLATGDSRWFDLMDDLAWHVRDVDIYHTTKDRDEYNGGLFWHTNHYLDAATCTHRSESADHLKYSDPMFCGGGPALEHNYTSGLMTHYLLTGEEASKEAVIKLADWVVTLMGRPLTFLELVFKFKSRLSLLRKVFSGEKVHHYPYPFTRESGNSITALLDSYTLTKNRLYLDKAEEIICGCINPHDDIDSRDLLNAELKWSYTVCLQAVGKFLDYKMLSGEIDQMFHYARTSLLKYAQWMLEHEYPYLDNADELEYPNETWPAQDMRKSSLFYHAAKYTDGEQRHAFIEKGRFYYDYALHAVNSFETRSLTRPLVLLLQNSSHHHCFMECPEKYDEKIQCILPNKIILPDNTLSRWNVLKMLAMEFFQRVVHFSPKKEIHWIMCKFNKHV